MDETNEQKPAGASPTPAKTDKKSGAAGNENGGEKRTGWTRFMSILPNVGGWLVGLMGAGVGLAMVWGLFGHDSIVRDLGNADLARGVITFIFAVGTIGIALLVTLGALLGNYEEHQLTRAKEILTVLIGVFGTILGFYFGAAGGNTQKLDIADIRITDRNLTTHVAGGTPPYRYSITSTEKDFKPIKDQISSDGWIVQQLESVPKSGKITVEVIDSRDLKASRERSLSTDAAPPSQTQTPTPSPRPGPSPSPTATPSPSPRSGTPSPTPSATP